MELDKDLRDDAEGELIDAQSFALTIACRGGRWQVSCVDFDVPDPEPDPKSDLIEMSIGEGNSFTEAWHNQAPPWARRIWAS
ncbi:hypothetical protein [Chelatococcus reniformis]|uniref:Uncharacterized protein n=1 Tax=Chelatococcus reniformis TaxID=1494448 RepID=A0A916UWQ8_9HYPH|nr:hypothetical protein [Chelatococcus reniformis]GGC91686.1 hypothetical protein GCM10010994_56810 [Chelatococcus reniformis]